METVDRMLLQSRGVGTAKGWLFFFLNLDNLEKLEDPDQQICGACLDDRMWGAQLHILVLDDSEPFMWLKNTLKLDSERESAVKPTLAWRVRFTLF